MPEYQLSITILYRVAPFNRNRVLRERIQVSSLVNTRSDFLFSFFMQSGIKERTVRKIRRYVELSLNCTDLEMKASSSPP